jgi:hypothetical protein
MNMADSTTPKKSEETKLPIEKSSSTEIEPPNEASLPPGDRRRRSAKSERKGPFVKYVGAASDRIVHPHDWVSLSVDPGNAPHKWSTDNDYLLESNQFNDEQLDYLLIDDMQPGGGHSFLEVDYDSEGNLVQVVD